MNMKKNLSAKVLCAGLLLLAGGYNRIQALIDYKIHLCVSKHMGPGKQTYEQAIQMCIINRYKSLTSYEKAQVIREVGARRVQRGWTTQQQQDDVLEKVLRGEPLK